MYHRENIFLNWLLIGLLIISGAAFAQGMMGDIKGSMPDYATLDVDADGLVTLAEARQVQGLMEMFGRIDMNADGKLDAAEYTGYQARVKGKVSPGG